MKRVALSSVLALAAQGRYKPPLNSRPVPAVRPQRPVRVLPQPLPVVIPQPAPQKPTLNDLGDDDSMWGYNPKAYDLDARPEPKEPVHIFPSAGENAANCKINPWLLMAFLNHAPVASVSKSSLSRTGYASWPTKSLGMDFVLKSLRGCRDNQKVKDVFAMNYLMEDKPELYKSLSTGSTDAEVGYKSYEITDGTGKKIPGDRAPLISMLGLKGKPFSDWTASKVYINMYKWKVYNGLYNGTPMTQVKRFQEQFNDYKKHRADAAAEIAAQRKLSPADWTNPQEKLDELPHWMPYLPAFFRQRSGMRG